MYSMPQSVADSIVEMIGNMSPVPSQAWVDNFVATMTSRYYQKTWEPPIAASVNIDQTDIVSQQSAIIYDFTPDPPSNTSDTTNIPIGDMPFLNLGEKVYSVDFTFSEPVTTPWLLWIGFAYILYRMVK
jgi:hypothetical protein